MSKLRYVGLKKEARKDAIGHPISAALMIPSCRMQKERSAGDHEVSLVRPERIQEWVLAIRKKRA